MAGKRLLLVDYDPAGLNHARQILENAGFEVSTSADGLSALDLFKNISPDIVLLSAMLPKMHGFEVCANMRKLPNGAKIPIVIITDVYKGKRYRLDAIGKYGATEYIEKPIEDAALVSTLQNLAQIKSVPKLPPAEVSADLDERTVQFNRDDLFAQMAKQKQGATVGKSAAEKKIASDKVRDDVSKKLEESLAGLDLNLTKKARPKPKPVEPVATSVTVAAPIEKIPETIAPPSISEPEAEPVSAAENGMTFTSEDLFTDIIESVERELQSTSFTPKGNSQPDTSPIPEVVAPTISMSAEDFAKAEGDLDANFNLELEKKLTSTLSGLRKEVAAASAKASETPALAPAPTQDSGTGATVQLSRETVKEALAAQETAAAEKGINFGQYLLLEKIATGGMAELFKAKRKGVEGFEKILAIKRILPHMSDNDEFITMFIDEAKLAAQLTHQNICQIFDLGKIENSYYIAMEYVHGKDLRAGLRASRSKKKPFPVELAILVISKISSALDYAHRKRDANGQPLNLVHRDISPQNILISYEGEVKLVDFGIAKAATKAHVTQHGALKGKLLYMSPEQAWGKAVDKRTDIFSLGVVLYEMLTGAPLFLDENDTEVTILEKVREARIGPVRELNPKVPESLEKILVKVLHKNPDERYQTALDLQKDLDDFFYSEGYNATSGSLANYAQSLFPEEWGKEAGAKDTVVIEKEITEALSFSLSAEKDRPKEEPAVPAVTVHEEPAKPKREGRIKIVPSAEKRIEPPTPSLQSEPVVEVQNAIKPAKPSVPQGFQLTPPGITTPAPEKSNLMTYIGIIAAFVITVIIAVYLFRPKPEEQPDSQPQATQSPIQKPVAEPPPVMPTENQQTPPVTAPVDPKDKQQEKIDELQKKVEEEEKKLAEKKAAEDKKKEDAQKAEEAQKKVEAAKLEEQKAAQVEQEEAKTESAAIPPAEEQQAQAVEVEPDPAPQQQEPDPVPLQAQEPPIQQQQDPPPSEVIETPTQEPPAPAKPEVQEGQLVDLAPDVVKPVIVSRVNPGYPPVAVAKKVEGTVLVSVLVSETGQVAEVKILRGAGGSTGLNEAAVSAVKKWKFQPAVKDGKRVKVWVTYPIVFKIQ